MMMMGFHWIIMTLAYETRIMQFRILFMRNNIEFTLIIINIMPKTDIDYSNTVFYKICCKNPDVKDVYIGHTTNFVQRKHAHKRSCANAKADNYNCKVYNVIREFGGWDNWKMEIIAFRECADHYEARKVEQQYFEEYNATLNSIEPMPKQKVTQPKVRPHCETCNVFFLTKTAHAVHNQTNKHLKMVIKHNVPNTNANKDCAQKFSCDICDYHTARASQYNRHLLTNKHETMCADEQKSTQNESTGPACECGKIYKERSGLWRHKRRCTYTAESTVVDINNSQATIAELLRQNQEFKQLMIDQNKQIQETQAQLQKFYVQNTELQNQIIELFKEGKPSNKFTVPQI
jgi:hypothetical protein